MGSPRTKELRAKAVLACIRARQAREELLVKQGIQERAKPAALCTLAQLKLKVCQSGVK
jgi:hypothetical protein